MVFPIVQSYKFKSKSQRALVDPVFHFGVSDSSKLQIQKQITTHKQMVLEAAMVFPIVQSYKFKSKSQLRITDREPTTGVSDSSKLQIQKQMV